mgnify:CR=1 FL=1
MKMPLIRIAGPNLNPAALFWALFSLLLLPPSHSFAAAEEPVKTTAIPLARVSAPWRNPATASLGLPSLRNGITRFATDGSIYEGPPQDVKPAIRSGDWIPEANETFVYFQRDSDRLNYDLRSDDAGMVFVGKNRKSEFGIYRTSLGRLSKPWVKPAQAIPHGVGNFGRLQYPASRGDVVVFLGYGSDEQKGVYRADKNVIQRIADRTTPMPGTGEPFHDFSYASVAQDGSVVFTGYSKAGSGIFISRNGEIKTLIDRTVREPRSSQPYAGALLAAVEEPWVYFTSFGGTLSIGRVRLDGSSVETLVHEGSFSDEQGRPLGAINYASVEGERVLFEGAFEGTAFNLFLWEKGSVRRLLQRGDSLDGGIVVGARSGLQSISGDQFVCQVDLQKPGETGFIRAVYTGRLSGAAPVPSIAKSSPRSPEGAANWLKLGQGAQPVFAREPTRTNGLPKATAPAAAPASNAAPATAIPLTPSPSPKDPTEGK